MCQQCVDAGEMTQEQWNDAKGKLMGPSGSTSPDLFSALEGLFGRLAPEPETKTDRAVRVLLDLVNRHTDALGEAGLDITAPGAPETTADTLALQLHYDQSPQSLAYALGVIALRYQDLLERWAELYVLGVKDGNWTMDDAVIKTPEAKAALTAAAED